MKTRLVVGETFRTKGGLEMEVERREDHFYLCIHRDTNWRGWYYADGEYAHSPYGVDPNLNAEFFV